MNKADAIFIDTIKRILSDEAYTDEGGKVRPVYKDGTPAYTRYLSQVVEKYDISKNEFPITTLRNIAWKSGIKEILWIYKNQTPSLKVLREEYGVNWWDSWDIGDDTIGQRYGATVKKHDQVNKLIAGLRENPLGRRHIISLWQLSDFEEKGGLDPCAYETLWTTRGEFLDCTLTIRSNDYLVAGHINRMQYVAFMMMIAQVTNLKPGNFMMVCQNLHIYDRHMDQANELLTRTPSLKTPILKLNPDIKDFYDFTIEDFEMVDYEPDKTPMKFELGI